MSNCGRLKYYSNKYTYLNSKTCIIDLHFIASTCISRLPTGWTVRGSNLGGVRFSAPVQTGSEAHPASCTMGTGSFPGVRCCRGVTLTPHSLLVQRSKIE